MHNKKQKLIWVLVMLVVLVSGMCFDEFKADSVFVREATQTANAVVTDAQDCATELPGICQNIGFGRTTVRFVNQRRDTKIFRDLLCQNIYSSNEENSYTSSDAIMRISKSPDELVTNYIHESYGKKRI